MAGTITNKIRARYNLKLEQLKQLDSGEDKNELEKKIIRIKRNKYMALYRYKNKVINIPRDKNKYESYFNISNSQPYYSSLSYSSDDSDFDGFTEDVFDSSNLNVANNIFLRSKKISKGNRKKFRAMIIAPDFGLRVMVFTDYIKFQLVIRKIYKKARIFQKKMNDSLATLVDVGIGRYKNFEIVQVNIYKAS